MRTRLGVVRVLVAVAAVVLSVALYVSDAGATITPLAVTNSCVTSGCTDTIQISATNSASSALGYVGFDALTNATYVASSFTLTNFTTCSAGSYGAQTVFNGGTGYLSVCSGYNTFPQDMTFQVVLGQPGTEVTASVFFYGILGETSLVIAPGLQFGAVPSQAVLLASVSPAYSQTLVASYSSFWQSPVVVDLGGFALALFGLSLGIGFLYRLARRLVRDH